MRIALGGIATESCTFTSLRTRREDFTLLAGDELLARYRLSAPARDVEFLPTSRARALPGGPVEADAYAELERDFLQRLERAAPLDGLYLDLHGAMFVEGREDAEADWIGAAREIVGEDCLVFASYDLHGNVSDRVFHNLDLLTAFRTAPHVDEDETRHRALALLVDCLRRGTRPEKAFVRLPLLLSGERTSTEWEPGAGLYERIPEIVHREGVLDASILVGYAWADEPRTGAAVTAYGSDASEVRRAAEELARDFWDCRARFDFGAPAAGIDESIRRAIAAPEPCVFLCDSGDNPTAGGLGDLTHVLARLLRHDVPTTVVASIADPEAVRTALAAGPGSHVSLSLGGKLDPRHGAPLPVRAEVLRASEPEAGNRQVVLGIGAVEVVVTERRTPFHRVGQFRALGIEPLQRRLVVVKIGYLVPELAAIAPSVRLVLSPGAVDQNLERLPYRRIERPIYPLDPDPRGEPWRAGRARV